MASASGSVAPSTSDPLRNHLLAALPAEEWQRWRPQLQAVDLRLGDVMVESGQAWSHVYFPTTAVVSLLRQMEDGASAEIAGCGCEGVVGVSLFMGGESATSRAVVQVAGQAFRLPASVVRAEFGRSGPVLQLLLRYTQALIAQMAQMAACNRHHAVEQQLCRWLLLGMDRTGRCELLVTQERIAHFLGVRREGVTAAALSLQRGGVIRYTRGHITVLDRPRLLAHSCECYGVIRREYDRLLPPGPVAGDRAGP